MRPFARVVIDAARPTQSAPGVIVDGMTSRSGVLVAALGALLFATQLPIASAEESGAEASKRKLTEAMALETSDPKQAKTVLKKLLPPLSKKGAIPEGSKEHVKLYNQAVSAARRLGVKCSATYRSKEMRSHSGAMSFDVPLETGWRENPNRDKADVVWQRAESDEKFIIVSTYRMEAKGTYSFENGQTAPGTNVKAIHAARFENSKNSMDLVLKAKPKIRSCAKKISGALGFEILGETKDEEKSRLRTWHFKSKLNKKWILYFVAIERGEWGNGDPELEFILKSMRETKRK